MINIKRAILPYICGGTVILGTAAISFAGTGPMGGKSVAGPFYNSATNSYFQLYQHVKRGADYRWAAAHVQAQRHSHKGERGRLAIVKDLKTLEFVRETFTITKSTWIGLRFFCKFRKLLWVDGQVQSPSAAGMWHSQWYRHPTINCNQGLQGQYMPVYLTGTNKGGVYWQASGPKKAFYYYLVEFPAPNKSKDVSHNSKDMTVPTGAGTTE